MTDTLITGTLEALEAFINDMFQKQPPPGIAELNVHIGRWMDSPEKVSPIITLHENNQQDTGGAGKEDWPHERATGSDNIQEMMGDTSTFSMYYRYSAQFQYFMTRSGENQEEALEKSRVIHAWLVRLFNAASISTLSKYGLQLPTDYGETAYWMRLNHYNVREGGGPPRSFIFRSTFFLTQLVSLPALC
jgi:hypothetical protein